MSARAARPHNPAARPRNPGRTLEAFRIVKARHAAGAFSGEGARRAGGRWNTPGTRLVYLAGNASLAVLELWVHLEAEAPLAGYVLIPVTLPTRVVRTLPAAALPAGWRRHPPPPALRALGDRFVAEARSAVLRVPSAVLPREPNLLLNPAHPDFARVAVGAPEPFALDPRLAGR